MGISESKDQAVQAKDEAEAIQKEQGLTDEQKSLVEEEITKDMSRLYEEVKQVPSLFSPHEVVALQMEDSDILILRYSHLQSMDEICENVKQNFEGFPGSNMVIDHTKKVLTSLRSAKSLKEIQRFHSTKMLEVVDGRSMGIEVHYKLKAVEEVLLKDTFSKKNTRIIVSYKYAVHPLKIEASKVPPTEDIKKIKFRAQSNQI